MQANNRDAGSLWDMVSAIRWIQDFTTSLADAAYLDSVLSCLKLILVTLTSA